MGVNTGRRKRAQHGSCASSTTVALPLCCRDRLSRGAVWRKARFEARAGGGAFPSARKLMPRQTVAIQCVPVIAL